MVDAFLTTRGNLSAREKAWWGDPAISFEQACRRAMFRLRDENKRDGHQRYYDKDELRRMGAQLASHEVELSGNLSFDLRYRIVERLLGAKQDGRPLLIYDVTKRLGCRFDCEPEEVYLHAGPEKGANALRRGLGKPRHRPLTDFPMSIRARLTAAQTEDFLCLASKHLRADLWD